MQKSSKALICLAGIVALEGMINMLIVPTSHHLYGIGLAMLTSMVGGGVIGWKWPDACADSIPSDEPERSISTTRWPKWLEISDDDDLFQKRPEQNWPALPEMRIPFHEWYHDPFQSGEQH